MIHSFYQMDKGNRMPIRKSWYVFLLAMLVRQPIFAAVSDAPEIQDTYSQKSFMLALAAGMLGVAWKKHYLTPIMLRMLPYIPEAVLRRTPVWLIYPSLKIRKTSPGQVLKDKK